MYFRSLLLILCTTFTSLTLPRPLLAATTNEHTDSLHPFAKLFQATHIRSLLEFGLGHGTGYFLDHCDEVTSCEVLLPSQSTESWDQRNQLFQNKTHWHPVLKRGSAALQVADERAATQKLDPALHDATYVLELKALCDELCHKKQFDVVFIDPRFHMRGDLVNELFDRVPIIVAHDTNAHPKVYGWNKIHTPSNYVKIEYQEGQGTTFWVRKDKKEVISALQTTPPPPETPRKQLRIFFPQMHPLLVQSVGIALHALGHTLVLPGESFDPNSPVHGYKLSYGTFFKKPARQTLSFAHFMSQDPHNAYCAFLDHAEVIETDEILTNPPDVICVNCIEVERSVTSIWLHLQSLGIPPKLLYFSGNNDSHFRPRLLKNLIAVDSYTGDYFSPDKNTICWLPWVDFEHLSFKRTFDAPVIGCYLGHYYASGAMSKERDCYYDFVQRYQREFPETSFPLMPGAKSIVPHDQLLKRMEESAATLHIKGTIEGYGYTIIESIAQGRPVFLKRSNSIGSRFMNWCIEGKTAFFFDEYEEFRAKLHRYLSDKAFRHAVQKECAAVTRRLIDNEKQLKVLDEFLQNLQ